MQMLMGLDAFPLGRGGNPTAKATEKKGKVSHTACSNAQKPEDTVVLASPVEVHVYFWKGVPFAFKSLLLYS